MNHPLRQKPSKPGNGAPVTWRDYLDSQIHALRWEMRAWVVGALVLSKYGSGAVDLVKDIPPDVKDAAGCIARACGLS